MFMLLLLVYIYVEYINLLFNHLMQFYAIVTCISMLG